MNKIKVDDIIRKVKGQSMVTAAITASGIIANLIGGVLLDAISVKNVLLVGVGISIVGALIVIFSVQNKKVVNNKFE